MTKAIDLSALFADTELPFGHPGRNFDESPAGYSDFHDRYEPPPRAESSSAGPSGGPAHTANTQVGNGTTARSWPRRRRPPHSHTPAQAQWRTALTPISSRGLHDEYVVRRHRNGC